MDRNDTPRPECAPAATSAIDATAAAITPATDPFNAVHVCVDREEVLDPQLAAQRLVSLNGTLWPNGKTLRVRFLARQGSARVRAKVLAAIKQWETCANLRFVASNDEDAEIRISFRAGQGSWSVIGKPGSDQTTYDRATMNLGWLNDRSQDSEYYVATHEAGHAIGFIHGQNAPNASIPWDEAKVYAYFSGPPNYWDRQTIYTNVLMKYRREFAAASTFDPDSIMQYPVDAALTTNGFQIGWNTKLSAGDRAYAGRCYPTLKPIRCPHPSTFLVRR